MSTPPFDPLASSAAITTSERSIIGDTTVGVPLSNTAKFRGFLALDCSAMAFGDEVQFKWYTKVSGGTQFAAETIPIVSSQPGWVLIGPFFAYDSYDGTLKKISGTDRTIRWVWFRDVGESNVAQWLGTAVQGTTIGGPAILPKIDLTMWLTGTPNALVSGRPDVSVGAMAANVLTAAATAADFADEIWDEVFETTGSETVRQALRLFRALLAGKGNTLTTNPAFRNPADTKDRVVFTMSGGGATRTPTTDVT